ncbi:MAG: TolC family protein, partial [Mycobacteriales bacterium]
MAYDEYEQSKSAVVVAFGAFLPVITPNYEYNTSRVKYYTGGNRVITSGPPASFDVHASWLLLDSGQRAAVLRNARSLAEASRYNALEVLRQLLTDVNQQFYDATRSQELLKVQQSALDRAKVVLDQTTLGAKVGQNAQKDVLQAQADELNAETQVLIAQNAVSTSIAQLKATIGWSQSDTPVLTAPAPPTDQAPTLTLDQEIQLGLKNRADLISLRSVENARRADLALARAEAWIN